MIGWTKLAITKDITSIDHSTVFLLSLLIFLNFCVYILILFGSQIKRRKAIFHPRVHFPHAQYSYSQGQDKPLPAVSNSTWASRVESKEAITHCLLRCSSRKLKWSRVAGVWSQALRHKHRHSTEQLDHCTTY